MPDNLSLIDVLQEVKSRVALSRVVAEAKLRAEATSVNEAETEALYTFEVRDPTNLYEAVDFILHTVRTLHPDVSIKFAQLTDVPNKFVIILRQLIPPAQPRTAADISPLESAPIAAQIADAVYGIATDGKEFFVLKNGEKATTAETLAEAFALWVGLLKQDLFLAVRGTEDFDRLEMDRDFLDGLIPVLLDSPTVSDKAAKALNSFYEMATLKSADSDV